ncbi:MAG: hypothetical protein JSV17_04665 [Candidatus Aminicenantes bacterium]|nr:MAG: hypothetical protein JSV17_04665 [Candidatus Aminicenantes bacterium]
MKKYFTFILAALFCLCLPNESFPQQQDVSFSSGLRIKPGAQFEYFNRTMTWDDEKYTTDLKATLFALNLEIEINEGFSISGLAGYVLSDYDALIFRQLPFSVELDAGYIGGYIFGAEIRKSLFHVSSFEFGLSGQFLYHMGKEKTWNVLGLNVTGTATGKPTWRRAYAGPYIKFSGLESLSSYLAVYYNKLWGRFEMKQTIQTLEGTEEKELLPKSLIDITIGTILTLSDYFFLTGEVHVLPYSDGMDLGFVAIAAFSF